MESKIQTGRTKLRRFQISDFENMRKLESETDIVKFTPMRIPQTPEQTKEKLKGLVAKEAQYGEFGVWAAELKSDSDFVGWFMLIKTDLEFPELGFMIVKKHWSQGFASEISEALLNHAKNILKLEGVSARTNLDNVASIRVLEKIGFQLLKEENDLKFFKLRL